ncbi:ATP-dependent DNA helicase [Brachybacterium alimentarium]|uniref:ATP-dependent DNA helicase n=1 Tax=Brachybacterium alimentarium TaxID=47845 RepID=UPI000DF374B0|nr:ATP-dependent DNA helicase [Brachybacterium alimentarium]RCS76044.1 ATP-dependent DNA helicase [Brachybacterium alimentarium]RCS85795.1 ATP-dependent DNA helicase [Brachybacterium alimentarium]
MTTATDHEAAPGAAGIQLSTLMDAAVSAIGGAVRPGQQAMAEAVDTAMTANRHLLVQAGTGTGKSLAYLVPALRHALVSGRPVVVSTATIALQTQIVRKDLPRLVEALAPHLPRTPTFALLKGRANYLCRHKIDGGYPMDIDPGALFSEASTDPARTGSERLGDQVKRLREWAEETDSGDRDSLEDPVSDRAWRQVSVTGSQCIGSSCPMLESCFAERSRELAREVDLVVTNHALMAIDSFDSLGIIPDHDVVVFDEAHDLSGRVTSAVTESLNPGMLRGTVRDLRGLGVAATALDDAAEELREALELAPDGRVIGALPVRLGDAVQQLRVEARTAHSDAKDAGDDATVGTAGSRKAVRANLQEIIEVCERLGAPADDDVVSVSHSQATGRSSIQVAPLSVAGAMRGAILESRTAVLTSATLALGGRFEPAAGEVGLARADRMGPESTPSREDRSAWAGLDVGSPFAYRSQGILYTARHLPQPGREGPSTAMLDHLTELVEASHGGALCLFSSRRGAELAAEHVRARLDLTIEVQGEDSMANLVRKFRDDEDASLFGTLTLWQGVDVSGPSLRLVTIDRIPFPRPDDPLVSARQERIAQQGGNGFMGISAQHAALLLAQGAGRLIRSHEDRGMVAVLDPRLATARYGSFLREAMPPLWPTSEPEIALGALRRLSTS